MDESGVLEPSRPGGFVGTQVVALLAVVAIAGWLVCHAVLARIEMTHEMQCVGAMRSVLRGLREYRAEHVGRPAPGAMSFANWVRARPVQLNCPSSPYAAAISTYMIPGLRVLDLRQDHQPPSRVHAAVICLSHTANRFSLDSPMLILSWDGTLYRIPKAQTLGLRISARGEVSIRDLARFRVSTGE